jgi:cytochrome c-type biogenesis protein CcmH/NrfF
VKGCALLLALLAAALLAGAAGGQDAGAPGPGGPTAHAQPESQAEPPSWGYELAAYLMSPFCPGRTLADCPSPQAQTLRMWILVQAASGRSREEVEEELYERFGDVIRPAPKAEGFGLAAYAIPVLAFLGGGVFVLLYLRRHTGSDGLAGPPSAGEPAPPSAVDADLERRVDEDLTR